MNNKAFILCVDDEPINITIMEELLSDNYELESVASGLACLAAIERRQPDLILLDVNMPDMDGLETCATLRNNPATMDIPIIFVSALATESELMAGYQAGGDDYITKPFSEEILRRKIEIVLEAEEKKQRLLEMTDSAVQALLRNQGSMSELDMVVHFLQDCFKQTEFHGLSKVVFNCLGRFDLDSSLLFLTGSEPLYWFSDEIDRPMERQILLSLNSQDRIVRFGPRMAINSSRATILVRNMPDDPESVTRLTEHLTIVIEGLEAKIKCMEVESNMENHQQFVMEMAANSKLQLNGVKAADKKQRSKSEKILGKLNSDIEQVAEKKELTPAQHKALSQAAKKAEDQFEKLNQERQIMHNRVETIIGEVINTLENS